MAVAEGEAEKRGEFVEGQASVVSSKKEIRKYERRRALRRANPAISQ